VQLRARDVHKGDVVSRDPARTDGWFRVHEVKALPDGNINILDKGNVRGFIAGPFDLIGLQTPVPLPAEADVTLARRRPQDQGGPADAARPMGAPADGATPAVPGAATTPTHNGHPVDEPAAREAAAREAAARALQAEADQVRGSLPGT
jgi:hypothetical protein